MQINSGNGAKKITMLMKIFPDQKDNLFTAYQPPSKSHWSITFHIYPIDYRFASSFQLYDEIIFEFDMVI